MAEDKETMTLLLSPGFQFHLTSPHMKVGQSEEIYKFALDVYDKSLAQVEAYLKELSYGKVGEVDISIFNHRGGAFRDIEEHCDTNTTIVTWIKVKERG
ncbi:unnamed protein product [Lupinus luteus]|uniref:Uncharacterized protein n=1 Tax=Lupinus luteus TaxID=3873 RepID=A0AAV1XX60_LUPLU